VHENLLPALDRAATILSRLRGLALFHSSSPSDGSALGFSADQVARIADAAAALALIGHRILLLVMEELDLFAVFSAWLRIRIDRAASTQAPDDATQEKEASIETGKVLAYIQRYLIPTVSPSGGGSADAAGATTPLGVFLEDLSTDEVAAATAQGVPADSRVQSLPARVDEQIRRIEKREPFDRALPRIVFLVSLVTSRADAMFAAIADTQRSSVRFGKPTRLGMATRGTARTIGGVDAAMAVDDGEDEDGTRLARVHVAMTPKERENERESCA
jgi:anaphase-promoting complex subunit 4